MFSIAALIHVLLILIPSIGFSQNLSNYSPYSIAMDEGLPSYETYKVLQDQMGYIWIATDNGLSRYDGQKITSFNIDHGLPANCVYHIFLQPDTSIVGISPRSDLFRIKHDSVSMVVNIDSSRKYLNPRHYPYAYFQDDQHRHHIGTRIGYYCFDSESRLVGFDTTRLLSLPEFSINPSPPVPFTYMKSSHDRIDKKNVQIKIWNNGQWKIDHLKIEWLSNQHLYCAKMGKYTFIPYGKNIIITNNSKVVKLFTTDYKALSISHINEQLFVTSGKKGVFCYTFDGKELQLTDHFLDGFSVSSVMKASNGQIWATTLEDGVKCIAPNGIQKAYSSTGNITHFMKNDTLLIVGFEKGELDFAQSQQRQKSSIDDKVYNFATWGRQILIFQKRQFLLRSDLKLEKLEVPYLQGKLDYPFQVLLDTDSLMVLSGLEKFSFVDKVNGEVIKVRVENLNKQRAAIYPTGKFYLSADLHHIYCFNQQNVQDYSTLPVNGFIILFFEHDDHLMALNSDGQLFQLKDGKLRTTSLPRIKGVNQANHAKYDRGILHVSNNIGVYSWQLETKNTPLKLMRFDNVPNCNQIEVWRDSLFFSTNRNIYKRHVLDSVLNHPIMHVKSIRINNEEVSLHNEFQLNSKQRNIEIEMHSIVLEDPILHYRYQLMGQDEQAYYSKDGIFKYFALSPGNYELNVAVTANGVTYSPLQTISFSIAIPYWQNWWFIALVIVILFLIGNRIWIYRMRQIRKKAELESTISNLRSLALAGQLNPHLIFNVLNSIQGKVSEGEEEEANIYIAQFARYLRNALNYLKVTSIALEEELKMTSLYFDLEKIRFGEKVKLTIQSEIKNHNVLLPPLVLQPLIENAIKYGDYSNFNREIDISFNESETHFFIIVSDNGMGFEPKKSFGDGLRITEERLKVLAAGNSVSVIHFKNPTRIQLKLKK